MLWGIKVPSKVRVFLWRLARCSLPSKDVLLHRNMSDSSACSIGGARDSWRHSLLECNMARCVWALEKDEITEHICRIDDQDAKGWLAAVMKSLEHEDLVQVTMTLWAIWYARRKAIHEDIYQSPLSTHNFVTSFVADLQLVQPKVKDRPVVQSSNTCWIPPPAGLMKMNVDAALAKNSGTVVAAAVARDFAERFLGASAVLMEGSLEPETVEAISCKKKA